MNERKKGAGRLEVNEYSKQRPQKGLWARGDLGQSQKLQGGQHGWKDAMRVRTAGR